MTKQERIKMLAAKMLNNGLVGSSILKKEALAVAKKTVLPKENTNCVNENFAEIKEQMIKQRKKK